MNKKKFELQFDVSMELSDIRRQLNSLSESMSKFELPADATKKLDGALKKTLERLADFETRSERGMENLADSKELEKAWASVTKALDEISTVLKTMDVSKLFPKEVKANIEGAKAALNSYVTQLEKIKGSDAYKAKVDEHGKAVADQKAREAQVAKGEKALVSAQATYEGRKAAWDKVREQYNQEAAQVEALNRLYLEQDKILKDLELKKAKLKAAGYVNDKGELSASAKRMEAAGTANKTKLRQAKDLYGELQIASAKKEDTKSKLSSAKASLKPLQTIKEQYESAEGALQQAKAEVESLATALQQAQERAAALAQEMQNLLQTESATSWQETVAIFKELTGIDLEETAGDVNAIKAAIEKYKQDELAKVPKVFDEIKEEAKETHGPVVKVGEALEEAGETVEDLERASNELDNLKKQVLDFFSVGSAINIFKRALSDAFQTVKELDAVMTEAAVVTDFSIGDMWEQMPQYSKNASELGVATRDLYAATTLYYQQGLKGNEVMKVGTETMKMAKIASMDATEATQAMTAALRGFNMQVDEMNAQKVSDVYSKLAAVTAADTSQIATAMSKTASIAASANMEFETTAAFLAQIIETTQEAPETAGTALKTIIARFSEVKNLQSQGLTSGMDAEGEAIDLNKISTALRSVGISMDAFFAGQEGLDDVLLRLSEKWDTLDFTTQRYIATAAAGSRQQSRFIAMMSNYGRTMELVNEANDSAGASQEQYQKTLEGLDAKLAQLKNAWDQFTMGLANNEVLKAGVDFLTWILETVNKLTDAVSGGNGLVKSLVSLTGVIGALKLGGRVLGKTSVGGMASGLAGLLKGGSQSQEKAQYDLGVKEGKARAKGRKDGMKSVGTGKDPEGFIPDPDNVNKAAASMNKLSTASMAAAGACGLVAAAFSAMGMEEEAEIVGTLAATFATLSTILPVVSTAITSFGAKTAAAGEVAQSGWGWIGLILAAIALLVTMVAVAVKQAKKRSLEYKLEQAKKATEEAKQAAEDAKAAYDALLDDKDKISTLQEKIRDLAAGTIAWKEALLETNQVVANLIEQYPELLKNAEYTGVNEYGQRVITEAGWEKVQEWSYNEMIATQAAYAASLMDEKTLAAESELMKYLDGLGFRGSKQTDLYTAIAKGDLSTLKPMIEGLEAEYQAKMRAYNTQAGHSATDNAKRQELWNQAAKLEKQINFLNDALNGSADAVNLFNEAISSVEAAMTAYAEVMFGYTSQSSQQNSQYAKMLAWAVQERSETYYTDLSQEEGKLKTDYKDNEEGLKAAYTQEFGAIPEGITTDQMISRLAGAQVAKAQSEWLDELMTKISNAGKNGYRGLTGESAERAMAAVLSGNISGLTLGELEVIAVQSTVEDVTQSPTYAATLGKTDDLVPGKGDQAYKQLQEYLSNFKGDVYKNNKDFLDSLDETALEQLVGTNGRFKEMSGEQQQTFIDQWKAILADEDLTDAERFSLKNLIGTTDWTNALKAQDAMDTMFRMGVNAETIEEFYKAATAGVETYIKSQEEAIQYASKLQNEVKSMSELSQRLSEGTATLDDIQKLQAMGVDTSNYAMTAEGFGATTEQIQEATEAWQSYAAARAIVEKQEIEEAIKTAVGEEKEKLEQAKNVLEQTIKMLQQPITTTYNVETHIDLFDRIKEAIVFDRQQEIDKLTEINDTIADSNSRIVTAMRESVEASRQARENERTEQEIADKQARLAYLKMDTSGANAMAIKQLEEEIAQDQESYTDRLIDQKISELEEQNNIAQEQRAQQIELMQLQLEQDEKTGALWGYVEKLFEEGYDTKTGKLREDSEAYKLLYQAENVASMSAIAQEEWRKELLEAFKGVHIHIYLPDRKTDEPEDPNNRVYFSSGAPGGKYAVTQLVKHASGGLVDYTGPAWLDGTKTNPEYVLSAQQTERFFELVDILSDLRLGATNSTQNSRENNFDIDINVESINSDYDVEQVAIKVKDFIVNSSRYRNNNTL